MPDRQTASEVFDREFLEIRHRLLDVASALDRINRSADASSLQSDQRMDQIAQAARIITDGKADQASRLQMVFSDEYDEQWR